MDTVNDYMKKEKFANIHRRELMAILERKLNINPKVKLIDIFPDHHDYKLFFANSFSLNSKVSAHAVEAGVRVAVVAGDDHENIVAAGEGCQYGGNGHNQYGREHGDACLPAGWGCHH